MPYHRKTNPLLLLVVVATHLFLHTTTTTTTTYAARTSTSTTSSHKKKRKLQQLSRYQNQNQPSSRSGWAGGWDQHNTHNNYYFGSTGGTTSTTTTFYNHHHQYATTAKSGKVAKSPKSVKAAKAKASSNSNSIWWGSGSGSIPYQPRQTSYPTRKPTFEYIEGATKQLEITMGGTMMLLAKNNLDTHVSREEMEVTAKAMEQSLLRALHDDDNDGDGSYYECDVYSIGDVTVSDGTTYSTKAGSGIFERRRRELGGGTGIGGVGDFDDSSSSSEVVVHFNCQTTRTCPDCTQTEVVLMGSQVFEDTFDILNTAAKEGELSLVFCILMEVARIGEMPCTTDITKVEGTSLNFELVDNGGGGAPSTTSSSSKPTTMKPTDEVVKWPPTPSPNVTPLPPPEPTGPPVMVVVTEPPVTVVTEPPVPAAVTPSPTVSSSSTTLKPISSLPTVSPNVTPTTSSPTLTTVRTLTPTLGSTTVPPVTSSPPTLSDPSSSTTTTEPTPSDQVPGSGGTAGPTTIPPGAIYYTGFEKGTFTEGYLPEWSTSGDDQWVITTEETNSGTYSIRNPNLDNDDRTPLTSSVTLTTNEDWPAGTLVFSYLAGTQMPHDNVAFYVDGQQRGVFTEVLDFQTQQLQMMGGRHNVTFTYSYNPVGLEDFPPEGPDRLGAAYIDDVYFLPLGVTIAPVPVSVPGTVAPVTVIPETVAPTPAGGDVGSSAEPVSTIH